MAPSESISWSAARGEDGGGSTQEQQLAQSSLRQALIMDVKARDGTDRTIRCARVGGAQGYSRCEGGLTSEVRFGIVFRMAPLYANV